MNPNMRKLRRSRPSVESLEGRALLTAGALDTSFGGTGSVVTNLTYSFLPQGLAVQSDLKTVVVGTEEPSPTGGAFPLSLVVVRYNVDGSLDSTFGSGGEVVLGTNSVSVGNDGFHGASVAIQPDGKIVVATDTATEKSGGLTSANMLILRFNTNGTLDTSFGQNGEADISLPQGMVMARGVAVLSSGQIIVAGSNPSGHVGPEFVVARLTSSGALDTTFGPNGEGYNYTAISPGSSVWDTVDAIGVDAAGDILVGGSVGPTSGSIVDQVVRYTPAGLIDTSFANQGVLDLSFGGLQGVDGIGFQSNGQIIIDHANGNGGPGESRRHAPLNPNGTIDTTFGSNGYFTDPDGKARVEIAMQPNDEILLESYLNIGTGGMLVDRLLPSGALDPAFGTGGRAELSNSAWITPEGIAVGPDGKITGIGTYEPSSQDGSGTFRLLGDAPVTGQVVVTQQPPAGLTAGTPFGLTVDVDDSAGNIESSFNGTVTVALANNPGGATLGGLLTVTATNGVATFSGLTLTTAASGDTLVVSGTSLGDAVTSAITITPSAPTQVMVTTQPPSSVTAGTGFGLTAAIEDAYGNVVTSASGTVSVALANNPGGGTLGGTLTAVASNGVAVFSGLTLTRAASGYALSVASSGLTSATTTALTVSAAAATQLVITEEPPASVGVNTGFVVVVVIEDAYGNVVTSDDNTVTVALGNNPSGAKLGGKLSVKAVNGVATFSGLTLSKAGSGYTLKLSSTGLTGATTTVMTVT